MKKVKGAILITVIKGIGTEFIELCLDKKVDCVYLDRLWKGEGWTKVRYSWAS